MEFVSLAAVFLVASLGLLVLAIAFVIVRDGLSGAEGFLEIASSLDLGDSLDRLEQLADQFQHLYDEESDVFVQWLSNKTGVSPAEIVKLLNSKSPPPDQAG